MPDHAAEMARTVSELTAPGKGILAADESTGTVEKRFMAVGVACTEETRREYRGALRSAAPFRQVGLMQEKRSVAVRSGLCVAEVVS